MAQWLLGAETSIWTVSEISKIKRGVNVSTKVSWYIPTDKGRSDIHQVMKNTKAIHGEMLLLKENNQKSLINVVKIRMINVLIEQRPQENERWGSYLSDDIFFTDIV